MNDSSRLCESIICLFRQPHLKLIPILPKFHSVYSARYRYINKPNADTRLIIMQNVSDIKFSLNNSQDLAVHSPKAAPDTGSSAGFFNMLKDRVSVSEQSAPGVPEKIEALKHEHSAPVDKEKEASGTATPKEERLPGAEKTADQAKPATQNQAAEAKDK